MSEPVTIWVGQWWSSPSGLVDTIQISRAARGFDDAWVVTSANGGAACLSTDYILLNYWLMDPVTVAHG